MYRIAVVLVVAACSKGHSDDCAIVRDKPASAMVELSKRYPNNPVKVAKTIEECVAPSGDECDRIAKVIAAIPAMAPQIANPKQADAAKTCRDAPPEFRRCLLPSYMLEHQAECVEAMTAPLTQIEIKPRGAGAPMQVGTDDCGFVAIYINKQGTWLATGRDAKARCFAPHKASAPDTDWLEAQLRRAKTHACGPSASELAGADDVPYQDVITAMDVSIKAGFIDTGLSSPVRLAVPLATANPKGAASDCPATLIAFQADTTATPPPSAPAASGPDKLQNAPVLIVTTTNLTLRVNDTSTDIATLAEARAAAKLDALKKALPPTGDGLMILQADVSTPMKVINLAVESAKAAGYDNVLFAVKNR